MISLLIQGLYQCGACEAPSSLGTGIHSIAHMRFPFGAGVCFHENDIHFMISKHASQSPSGTLGPHSTHFRPFALSTWCAPSE